MKKQFSSLVAGLSCTLVMMMATPVMGQRFSEEMINQGRYLATASDCIACHTSDKRKPMAGGHAIDSPVGRIVATNITPSRTFGIGNYTEQQFADAVRLGVRADGARLYPAMPYTAFSYITDEDIHALYAYFMEGVKPVDEPTEPTELPFPMNIRASMIGWNFLFANTRPFEPDAAESELWNRGRYLSVGPGHCATCHTPRGFTMQEKTGKALQGAHVGAWFAPDITSSSVNGIGSWSVEELMTYLATGRLEGKAQAAGPMAEAVTHSFSRLREDDLRAISTYILSVPPSDPIPSVTENRFDHGGPGDLLVDFRGTSYEDGMRLPGLGRGAQIYSANCASCHGYEGQGTRDAYYPSLFGKSITGGTSTANLIAVILNGVERETPQGGHVFMPPFGDQDNAMVPLDNDEIAALSNYIFTFYGNPGLSVTPAEVQVIRDGGPKSDIVLIARIGLAAGVLVVLGLGVWLFRRRRANRR